jgi:hypothetical protein
MYKVKSAAAQSFSAIAAISIIASWCLFAFSLRSAMLDDLDLFNRSSSSLFSGGGGGGGNDDDSVGCGAAKPNRPWTGWNGILDEEFEREVSAWRNMEAEEGWGREGGGRGKDGGTWGEGEQLLSNVEVGGRFKFGLPSKEFMRKEPFRKGEEAAAATAAELPPRAATAAAAYWKRRDMDCFNAILKCKLFVPSKPDERW